MKYFKLNSTVFAFSEDQLDFVTTDMVEMTEDEIDKHLNPEKYLSDDEKLQLYRERMPQLTPMDFDLRLDKFGLYDDVQDLISSNRTLSIAYNRALYFRRTDHFIEQARIALNLTHEQIDAMWTS